MERLDEISAACGTEVSTDETKRMTNNPHVIKTSKIASGQELETVSRCSSHRDSEPEFLFRNSCIEKNGITTASHIYPESD